MVAVENFSCSWIGDGLALGEVEKSCSVDRTHFWEMSILGERDGLLGGKDATCMVIFFDACRACLPFVNLAMIIMMAWFLFLLLSLSCF